MKPKADVALQWAVCAALTAVEGVLLWRLAAGTPEAAAFLTCMAVVAALLVISIRVFDFPGLSIGRGGMKAVISIHVFDLRALSIGKGGPKAELDALKEKVEDVDRRVKQLFLLTMSPDMYFNLSKFASGRFGPYEMNGGLERELFHLRDIGYINFPYISQIPKRGGDLSAHVRITEAGKRFVELRMQMDEVRKQIDERAAGAEGN